MAQVDRSARYSPMAHGAPSRDVTSSPRTSVLLVEPDESIAAQIADDLTALGHDVHHVVTGRDAAERIRASRPDIVALDLLVPDIDGLVLLGDLKSTDPVPVIILSRTKRRADAVLGFRLGADDFIAYPFEPHELDARIRSTLVRGARPAPGTAPEPACSEYGGIVLDHHACVAQVDGRPVQLDAIECRLLAALLRSPERIVPARELAALALGSTDAGAARGLETRLGQLRLKLRGGRRGGPTIVPVRPPGSPLARPAC